MKRDSFKRTFFQLSQNRSLIEEKMTDVFGLVPFISFVVVAVKLVCFSHVLKKGKNVISECADTVCMQFVSLF
jgi:hypothetical protein